MAQVSSGTILREARERKGYELATVARRLRIRPDILEAIENGDFSNMPPRGYARNMVNAYARLLGLNPTEIVHMYLDEAYANQVQKARSSAPARGSFEIGHEHRYSRSSSRSSRLDSQEGSSSFSRKKTVQRGGMTRDLYDDRTEFARHDYGLDDGRTMDPDDWRSPQRKAHRTSLRSDSSSNNTTFGFGIGNPFSRSESRRSSRGTTVGSGNYTNFYAGPRAPGITSHLPLIIGLALVLVIIIIVLAVFIGGRGTPKNDVADLPVTGISDTTGTEEEVVAQPVELAPTSVRVRYEVKPGVDDDGIYVEIYENDGDAQPMMLHARESNEFDVTGKWVITCWASDDLIITVDGKRVNMISDNDHYDGMPYYVVDFNQVLNKWNEEHNITPGTTGQQQQQQSNGMTASAA